MFKFLLATMLIVAPGAALAGPVIGIVAGALGVSAATAAIIVNIGVSLLLSAAAAAFAPKPKVPDLKRELARPDSRPPYRFVYGRDRVYGSPAPWRVKGRWLYGCLILNSRPSRGNVEIFFDKRLATLVSGDMGNFTGGGGRFTIEDGASNSGHVRVWLGLGDQIGPPDELVADVPEFFRETDGWRGRTVLWVKLNAGGNDKRHERWPRVPPEIEAEIDGCHVWDPRDPMQDADDPSTWAWSDNQALCLLDALRMNPIRRYRRDLIYLDTFIEGASIADQMVARRTATPERRYTVNGLLAWNGQEIVDQVTPLAEAGAGRLARVGSRIAYASGAWREPIYTMRDIIEDGGIDYQVLRPGRDLPRAVKVSYIAPNRDWQEAELPPLDVPGAAGIASAGDDGIAEMKLSMVTSPTQAMRIQKIAANRMASQRRLQVTLWPDGMELVGGANLLADMPEGFERLNGTWQVETINPGLWLTDEGGIALRLPAALREERADTYAWDPDVDEFDLVEESLTLRNAVPPPGPLTVWTGTAGAQGGNIFGTGRIPGIRFSFPPSAGDVDYYEWQSRGPQPEPPFPGFPAPPREWHIGEPIRADSRDSAGMVPGHLFPVAAGELHDIRVRAVVDSLGGVAAIFPIPSSLASVRTSDWVEVTDILALPPDIDLDPPSDGQAVGSTNEIGVSFRAPNSGDFAGLEFWAADVDDLDEAVLLDGAVFGSPNATFEIVEASLGDGVTRYYWARSIGPFNSVSPFVGPVFAITDL